MLRLRNLRNKYQKRLIRPLYAQTQATPYAAALDPSFRDPVTKAYVQPAGAYAFNGLGLVPGTVMTQKAEFVTVHTGAANVQGFGLLANFVGGDLDDLGDENFVGVWRGPDSVYELLAPAWNENTGANALTTAWNASTPGVPVNLYPGADGRLTYLSAPAAGTQVVARLIDYPSPSRIVIDLAV